MGAVAGAGTLAGKVIPAPATPAAGLVAVGDSFSLEVTGTELIKPVTISFPAPAGGQSSAGAPKVPLLAYYDQRAAVWTPVESRYDPATGSISAVSPHLSWWSVFRVDTSVLINGATGLLKGVIGIGDHTTQPSSDGSGALASAGVTIRSSSGSLVKWSAGVTGGVTRLKVVDNRGYALALRYPASWSATRVGGSDDVQTAIVDWVSGKLTAAPNGERVEIIAPGKGMEFTLPAGGNGTVVAEPNPAAYLVSGLLYGVDRFVMTLDALPWVAAKSASKTLKAVRAMLATRGCVTSMSRMATTDVRTAHGAGEVFRTAAELATGCLADTWGVAYGVVGVLREFFLGVLLWLVDGIKLVFEGLRAALDTALYFGGYQIAVSQPAPVAQTPIDLSGTWQASVSGDYKKYDIRVVLTDSRGELKATVEYPQLSCRGSWTQVERSASRILLTERITSGRPNCVDAQITLAPRGDAIGYRADPSSPTGRTPVATLHRI